jgi:hypothetical protein
MRLLLTGLVASALLSPANASATACHASHGSYTGVDGEAV